jgi:hypothetical protein
MQYPYCTYGDSSGILLEFFGQDSMGWIGNFVYGCEKEQSMHSIGQRRGIVNRIENPLRTPRRGKQK